MAAVACPVRGCTRTISGYSRKSQAKSAAELEPFVDMIRRLVEVRDTPEAVELLGEKKGWDRQNLAGIADAGEAMESSIDEANHGAMIRTPDVKEWRGWRELAVDSCIALAIVDKQWCIDYWAAQMQRGVKVPLELRGPLKSTGVIP